MVLDGSVAVVTGAGTGIGREIALTLGAEGADVVLTGRSIEAMEDVAAQLRASGRDPAVIRMDVRDPASVEAAARHALERFGRVDVLVNNSGVGGPSRPLWEVTYEEWGETFDVNVTGTFLCCRAFVPAMLAAGRGSIVMIGSMTGKRPLVNRTPYASSKTALIGLVRTLAAEVGPVGIRVNLVSPGGVAGPRLDWVIRQQAAALGISEEAARDSFRDAAPLRRLVTAGDVARVVVFLASPAAAAITGADINVSAGLVMY